MKLYQTLQAVLRKEPAFVDEAGKLKKQIIIEKARMHDKALIKLLLTEPALVAEFFDKIDETLIFNKYKFIQFLEYKNYLNDSYTSYDKKIGLALSGGGGNKAI